MISRAYTAAGLVALGLTTNAFSDDSPLKRGAKPVATNRGELKRQLEDSKHSNPRLPLPPPTQAEIDEAEARAKTKGAVAGLGGIINNGRMRKLYLPASFVSGGFQREKDPAQTLNNAFKVELFWIVSRANNCVYCQGHQEVKLAAEGVDEATIAALDGDWSGFSPAEQAAFAFTLKITNEPQAIGDSDIARLKEHYNDLQILEILTSVAGFNAMNRWTGPLAIPQEDHRTYLTETPERFRTLKSKVAPLDPNAEGMACARPASRGPLEDRAAVETALQQARSRKSRLVLAAEDQAKALLGDKHTALASQNWARLLADFPKAGPPRVAMHDATEKEGKLSPTLNAAIAWAAAREDRAWYALAHARTRLKALGLSDDSIFAIDAKDNFLSARDREAVALARKITVNPALIDDQDIVSLRKSFTDHEVAEIVFQATEAAYFNRLTEAAGLTLEP